MTDINTLFTEIRGLGKGINSILKDASYDDYGDLSSLDIDYEDSEQLFLLDELQAVMEKLDEVRGRLAYLALPIREVGTLHKNESGRYETESGHYYTCGSSIEALVQDSYREVPRWVWTRVEGNGRGYYLVGYDKVDMDGLTVRVRGEG